MQLRKPALLLASQCSISCPASHSPITSSISPAKRPARSRLGENKPAGPLDHSRRYATASDGLHLPWPDSRNRHPTPYEILGLSKGSTYSKARFYELVKVYHPDRSHAATQADREEMIERYRLIITAHTILSDPQKRKAYDEFGLGWHDSRPGPSHYRYTSTYRWRSDNVTKTPFEDDPMYNANWEDWERWYQRQWERERAHARGEPYPNYSPFSTSFFTSRQRGRTVYISNYRFISILFLFAALGAVGQATRFEEAAKSRTQQLNHVSEQTSAMLLQARQDTKNAAGEDKRDRIRRFVREKEDRGAVDEFDGRVLRPGVDDDVCASGAVGDRDEPRFWEKPPENR